MACKLHEIVILSVLVNFFYSLILHFFGPPIQAKMGMMEDFEASLQVLRGFDADITVEVNEIKVEPFQCLQFNFEKLRIMYLTFNLI